MKKIKLFSRKKSKIKIFLALSLVALLVGGSIFLYLKSRKFTLHLKVTMKTHLENYIGRPVEIARVSTDIFNRIILSEVYITEPDTKKVLLQVKKIKIKYSLLRVIKKIGNIQLTKLDISLLTELISEISFYNPSFTLIQTPRGLIVEGLEKIIGAQPGVDFPPAVDIPPARDIKLPPWKFRVINGRLDIKGLTSKTLKIVDIDGRILLAAYPEIYINTTFGIDNIIRKLNIEARYQVLSEDIEAVFKASGLELNQIDHFLGDEYNRRWPFHFDSGRSDFNLSLKANLSELKKDYKTAHLNGEIKIHNAMMKPRGVDFPLNIAHALLNVSPERLSIERCLIKWDENSIQVAGIIKNYLHNPDMKITTRGNIHARHLLKDTGIKKWKVPPHLNGIFEIDASIEGTPGNIKAVGRLFMDRGEIFTLKIEQLRTTAEYEKGTIKFSAGSVKIAGGNLIWEGDWKLGGMSAAGGRSTPGGMLNVKARGESIALHKLLYGDGPSIFQAILGGNVFLRGDVKSIKVDTDLTIENLIFADRKFEHIALKGTYEDLKLSIEGFTLDGRYSVDGKFSLIKETAGGGLSTKIMIDEFTVSSPKDAATSVSGKFTYSPFSANLSIKTSNLEVAEIPFLKKIHPGSSGNFNFAGNIDINTDALKGGPSTGGGPSAKLTGKFDTDNYTFKDESYSISGRVDINSFGGGHSASEMVIKLTELDISGKSTSDGYLKGGITIKRGSGKSAPSGKFSVISSYWTADKACLRRILILSGRDFKVDAGYLSGNLNYTLESGDVDFTMLGLSVAGLELGDMRSKLTHIAGEWKINQFQLVSGMSAPGGRSNPEGGGKITAQGKLYPLQDIRFELLSYDVQGRKLCGTGIYTSGFEGKNYVFKSNIKNLTVQDRSWPSININGQYYDRVLKGKLTAGGGDSTQDKVLGDFFLSEDSLECDIQIKNFSFRKILDALNSRLDMDGTTDGSLKIMGNPHDPLLYLKGNLSKGKFHLGADIPPMSVSVSAELEYQTKQLKIEKLQGTLGKSGRFKTTGGIYKDGVINSTIEVRGVEIKLLKMKDLTGLLDATVEISGTIERPIVSIDVDAKEITLHGADIKKLSIKAIYDFKKMNLKTMEFFYKGGRINLADGSIEQSEQQDAHKRNVFKIDVNADFKNIVIGPVSFFGGAGISGRVYFSPFGVELDITPAILLINRLRLVQEFKLIYQDKKISVNFKDGIAADIYFRPLEKIEITIDGIAIIGKALYSPKHFSAQITGENIQINNIIKLLDWEVDYYGKTSFDINLLTSVQGAPPVKKFHLGGKLDVREGSYKGIKLEKLSGEFTYDDGNLDIVHFALSDPHFLDITARGQVSDESNLAIKINRFSLAVLENISDEIKRASGYFSGTFIFKGSLKEPEISGSVDLTGGRIYGKNVIDKITSIKSIIIADGSRLKLKEFTADIKPGKISGSGFIDLKTRPVKLDLSLKTISEKGVGVKIPYLDIPQSMIFGRFLTLPSSGEPKFNLRLYNSQKKYYIVGDVTWTNTHFSYPPISGSLEPPSIGFINEIVIDINLIAGESVWYENTFTRAKAEGALHFKKQPGEELMINGEVTSSEGMVTYFNRDYNIREMSLTFEDTVEYIFIVAETEVARKLPDGRWEDDIIQLTVPLSRVGDMIPKFHSTSNEFKEITTSEEALQFVVAGMEFDHLSPEERNMVIRREFLRAIDAKLTTPLVKNILKKSDIIDVAKIDIKVGESIEDRGLVFEGVGLKVGRYFTDRFYLGYYVVSRMENPLRLSHELDMFYRLGGSQFLRGRISEEERFLGIEHQIRF